MSLPIPPIILPPLEDAQTERIWLQKTLRDWLDNEFIPEVVNETIASRAADIYIRHRLEGENELGAILIAIVTEMRFFDFSNSFYSEFAVANAVSDILLCRLGRDICCGNQQEDKQQKQT
ncbi:MAG: hypothetical protein NZ901_10565 [Geminocystis sp.]|nr:hypothetical protein [Geminocystis sp.]HIK37094.1 hypothetical protein [Geminocystis sp. M7585_C2015_104]MCS7148618.1 hypothetical protein [Geminocystis sp.]MCX8079392.1 hypothetical protein [Geminocystis sp.]MDW8114990.1 hypothetical protein [Geminocystis sp.]